MPQTQSATYKLTFLFTCDFFVWLKAHENENAKAWEDESALFSRHLFFINSTVGDFWNTSEIFLILMTLVLASCV